MTRQRKPPQKRRRQLPTRAPGALDPSAYSSDGPAGNRPRRRSSPARVSVSDPGDLVGLVPYLLGFRPAESLVVLLIRDGRVLLTARVDLPPTEASPGVLDGLRQLAEQHRAAGMVLLAYGAEPESTRALLDLAVGALEPCGLLDALYVDDRRWWSLMCDGSCCPGEGTPYDLSTHPMAAEAVYAGMTAASGRDEITAMVSGPPPADLAELERLCVEGLLELSAATLRQRQELIAAMVGEFVDAPRQLDDVDCARLALLARDVLVRDVAWAAMCRRDSEQHVDLWGQVVRRAIAPWELAPVCLLGMAAWISGNGALQNCCIDRAREADPSYTMTNLLEEINRRALPPSFWDEMGAEMRGAVGPLAR